MFSFCSLQSKLTMAGRQAVHAAIDRDDQESPCNSALARAMRHQLGYSDATGAYMYRAGACVMTAAWAS